LAQPVSNQTDSNIWEQIMSYGVFIAHMSQLRTLLTAIQEGTALLLDNIPAPLTPAQRKV
jgi:hypothetical protein